MSPMTQPRLDRIRVADAMHAGVLTCAPDTSLPEVATAMATHRVHCMVVSEVERGGKARWSVVSDLDLVGAAAAGELERLTAGEIAATDTVTVSDDEHLDRAMQRMATNEVSHLVVVAAASGRPTGILSTLDVAAVLASR